MDIQSPIRPHFGGVWERLIQSAKRKFLPILGSRRLSFDTFLAIIVETESILNSRPLTNVAEQPENEEPLTPNHLPIQRPFNSLPEGEIGDQQPTSSKTWKNTQKLMNHIWRRLVKEYLPTLSRRSEWSNRNNRPLKVNYIQRLGVERPNTKRHLATWKSHGDNTRTRWRNTSREGKNGLQHVHSPRFRSRTRFFSVVSL